jgi:hypothetical protein
MNRILYENRCKCNEEFSIIKKRKSITRSEGKPLQYLNSNEVTSKIFQIKYEQKLSTTAKLILNSLHNKYIYYAIDDILYLLKSDKLEQENLLAIIYSPVLSLQNNFSVNFFDIWIRDIYINETQKYNKFIKNDSKNLENFSYITIKLFYKTRITAKKQESLW